MKNLSFYLSLAFFCLSISQSFSQTTFTGAISNDWSDSGNWDNGIPAPGNDATIPQFLSPEIHGLVTVDFTIKNYWYFYVECDGQLINHGLIYNLNSNGQLINYGKVLNTGFIMSDGSSMFFNEGLVENEGIISNAGLCELINHWGGLMINTGTIYNSGGFTNYKDIINHGDILNLAGYIENLPSGTIHNFGTLTNAFSDIFYNNGIVNNCFGTFLGIAPSINPIDNSCPTEEICDGVDNDGDGEIDEVCGCTDVDACNYDSSSTLDDSSCVCECLGCTDPTACNFLPPATTDDGSCILPDGCTDSSACNYDAGALCDDGSCEHISCLGCPGDLNNDLEIDTADLLLFLSVFGGNCF